MEPRFPGLLGSILLLEGRTLGLIGGVLVLLATATAVLHVLRRRPHSSLDPALLERFRQRLRGWWILCAVLAGAFLIGKTATVVLFGFLSFWALREFITLTPTRPGDHRALFWVFVLCTPAQYVLVGLNQYDLFSILIPVYAFLLIPARIAMAGDPKRFLERTAKIQSGLLICVYCLSYAPALLNLSVETPAAQQGAETSATDATAAPDDTQPAAPEPAAEQAQREPGRNARLLFFFILMVQFSDTFQYAWAQLPSKHVIAPTISPTKTWEGLLGGTASVTLLGAILWWATPFSFLVAAGMSAVIALMGFAGGLTMSAIKRDRGVKDYGTLVEGHGGVLDRIDSLCFAAPVFFHLTRLYLLSTAT